MLNINVTNITIRGVRYGKPKWNEMFITETDLLNALYQLNCNTYSENGCEYVKGFQTVLHKGGSLTPKQLTQLKRVAKFIFIHYKNKQSNLLNVVNN